MIESVKTVKMHKLGQPAGMPTNADVHPNEVANWQATGWVISPVREEVKRPDPLAEAVAAPEPVKKQRGGRKARKTSV